MHEIKNNGPHNIIKCIQTKDIIQAKYDVFNENLGKIAKEFEEEEKRKRAAEEAMKLKKAQEEAAALKLAQEAQAKKLAEQETANKLAQQKELKKQQVQNVNDNDKNGINSSTFASYEQTKLNFERIRKEVEDCFNITSQKLYKFDLQKAINFPLNSLLEDNTSEDNRKLYAEKKETLLKLLSGQSCAITTTLTVNTGKHPRAVDFCLVYLARKLVEKGEETVASRPETSFQYVQVVIEVFKKVKNFEPILMGQFQEK
jgi:DNA-binding helix-hairpin-helix protein with protein kinase domain